MQYQTTRQAERVYSFSEMIRECVPIEGGLFVPFEWPDFSPDFLGDLQGLDFLDRTVRILSVFAPDLSAEQINNICQKAFNPLNYKDEKVYEIKQANPYLPNPIFLFAEHGPSACYKDYTHAFCAACLEELIETDEQWFVVSGESAQSMKSLAAIHREDSNWQPVMLTDRKATNNFLLKEIQNLWEEPTQVESDSDLTKQVEKIHDELTIYTVNGRVQEIESFSQRLFYVKEFRDQLREQNKYLASFDSLNFAYHIALFMLFTSAYLDLLNQETLVYTESFILAFPNLNLDFLYTGQLLQKSNLPVSNLFAVSNSNRSITDFLRKGKYKLKRRFFRTNTPSLDQVYYSNIERLLFEISDQNCLIVDQTMTDFVKSENIDIPAKIAKKMKNTISTGYSNNKQTISRISEWYLKADYLFDPYTALTLDVLERFEQLTPETDKIIIPVIENPLLSAQISAEAILDRPKSRKINYNQLLEDLSEESGVPIPNAAYSSKTKPATVTLNVEEMFERIKNDLLEA